MQPLRIGVNALYLIPGGVGGTEIYLHELLRALAEIDARNEYFVFTNRETGPELVPQQPNFHAMPQRVRARFRPARILWEQTALPLAAAQLRLDALLNPGFTAPIYCPCPAVTVFHDMQHKRHPEHFRWFDLPFWRVLLYASAHLAGLVLADSESTRADVLRYYRLPPERVRMVRLGVDRAFFGLRRAPEKLLLTVSTLHPHKGLDALLRAFADFRRAQPEFRLVVAACAASMRKRWRNYAPISAWWTLSSLPAGLRARNSTICTRAPGRFCIPRHSRDSVCPSSRRWPPAFPPAARTSSRSGQ